MQPYLTLIQLHKCFILVLKAAFVHNYCIFSKHQKWSVFTWSMSVVFVIGVLVMVCNKPHCIVTKFNLLVCLQSPTLQVLPSIWWCNYYDEWFLTECSLYAVVVGKSTSQYSQCALDTKMKSYYAVDVHSVVLIMQRLFFIPPLLRHAFYHTPFRNACWADWCWF